MDRGGREMTNWEKWTMDLSTNERYRILCSYYLGHYGYNHSCNVCPIGKVLDEDCISDNPKAIEWLEGEVEE